MILRSLSISYVQSPPTATSGFSACCGLAVLGLKLVNFKVTPKKLETGLRTISAGIPYTLLLRIEAIGFPTFGLLLYARAGH